MPHVTSELLQHRFRLPDRPSRVVSLVSSATETIEALGRAEVIAGMSEYCPRYVERAAPIVGKYIKADLDAISALQPDLVLVTSGIQTPIGRRLAEAGLPAYALALPASIHGVLENIITVAALIGQMSAGRELVRNLENRIARLPSGHQLPTYVEIWFGKHMRTVGGRSFITDIIELAGGQGLFSGAQAGYLKPDLGAIGALHPELMIALSEPEYPIDFPAQIKERDWRPAPRLIISTIKKGQNIIHDGPSIIDTIEWLSDQMLREPGRHPTRTEDSENGKGAKL